MQSLLTRVESSRQSSESIESSRPARVTAAAEAKLGSSLLG